MDNKLTELIYDQWTKSNDLSSLLDYSKNENLFEYNLKDFVSDLISTDNDFPFFMGSETDTETFIETVIDTVFNAIDKDYMIELINKDVTAHVEGEDE